MNTNEIIKAFDVNEVTIDETNIYLKFTIDRQKALSRNAKYIKVCIEAVENIVDIKKSKDEFFEDDLTFDFKSNSSPAGLNLYKFENNLLDLTIEDDEVSSFKEYFLSIPKIVARNIVGGDLNLQETPSLLDAIPTQQEKKHAFKVYILNKSRSILEKYNYESEYKLDEYTSSTSGEEFLFRSLEGSLDLVLTPYNAKSQFGPYLNVNKEILENPAIKNESITVSLIYNNETYSYNAGDLNTADSDILTIDNQLSNKPINSIFRRDFLSTLLLRSSNSLIADIFENFYVNNLNEDTIEFKFAYESEEITKYKKIDRSTIESLYTTYFNRNKNLIISSLLRNKIEINSLESHAGFSILFKKYKSYLIPTADFQNKIKVCKLSNGITSPVTSLYVSTSFDNDIRLETYSNNGFLVQSIYDTPNNNSKFYIKSSNTSENFVVYFNNVEIFKSEVFNSFSRINNTGINSTGANSVGIDRLLSFDNVSKILNLQSTVSNLGYNLSINNCFSTPRINQFNNLEFDFDSSELRRNISSVIDFGYNINNNDYINREIIENVILKFVVRSVNRESVIYASLNNILEDSKITVNVPFQIRTAEVEIYITTVILPYNMVEQILKTNVSDDIKEDMVTFLYALSPNSWSMINRVMHESLFQGKREIDVISDLFLVLDNYKTSIFIINNDESADLNNLLNNVIITEEAAGT